MENSENSNDNDNNNQCKDSYLPSWVIKMRMKIFESRLLSDDISNRLDQITISTQLLDNNINKLVNKSNNHINTIKTIESTSSKVNKHIFHEYLPWDIIVIIISYLSIQSIIIFDNCSNSIHSLFLYKRLWTYTLNDRFTNNLIIKKQLETSNNNQLVRYIDNYKMNELMITTEYINRNQIIRYIYKLFNIVKFVNRMKDQRCITSDRSLDSHRYNKSFSHPYPINSSNKSINNYLSMSSADYLNSDMRVLANQAMQSIFELTSDLNDTFIYQFVKLGGIAVITSLLSNESGSLQGLSSSILANLLCKESYDIIYKISNSLLIKNQMFNCQSQKILVSLLTSPTATVNIINSITTSSSVQGIATKESSRALLNLYSNHLPIPSSYQLTTCINSYNIVSSHRWLFSYYYKSGILKGHIITYLLIDTNRLIKGYGVDDIGPFYLSGSINNDLSNGYTWFFYKTYIKQSDNLLDGLTDINIDIIDNYINQFIDNNSKNRSHISHMSYWSEGLDVKLNNFINGYKDSDCDNLRGSGIYGVWETTSNNLSFELQKGGMFRASPYLNS